MCRARDPLGLRSLTWLFGFTNRRAEFLALGTVELIEFSIHFASIQSQPTADRLPASNVLTPACIQ